MYSRIAFDFFNVFDKMNAPFSLGELNKRKACSYTITIHFTLAV